MDSEHPDWREAAFEVYRVARAELLHKWKELKKPGIDYYIEELTEALLDLKQATIEEDPVRALEAIDEVTLLLAELRLRWPDGD